MTLISAPHLRQLALALAIGAVGVIAIIVFFERAQRRIIVQYPKRQVGNRMFGGESSHIPLKLNYTSSHKN